MRHVVSHTGRKALKGDLFMLISSSISSLPIYRSDFTYVGPLRSTSVHPPSEIRCLLLYFFFFFLPWILNTMHISMKLAQWHIKPKELGPPGYKHYLDLLHSFCIVQPTETSADRAG